MTIMKSSTFLQMVKQKAALTAGQVGLSDNDILAIATRRLQNDIIAIISELREEYLLKRDHYTLVANQSEYRIPIRASGGALRHIFIVNGNQRVSIYKMKHEDLESFSNGLSSLPSMFLIEGNYIRLLPDIGSNPVGKLELYYIFRPNSITQEINCRQIVSLDKIERSVILNSIPASLTSSTKIDIINDLSGNEIIAYDLTKSSIVGTKIIFNEELDPKISIGNWICPAEQSPVPMVPEEFQQLLLGLTVLDIQNMRGNQVGAQIALGEVKTLMDAISKIASHRIASKSEKIIPRNALSQTFSRGNRW